MTGPADPPAPESTHPRHGPEDQPTTLVQAGYPDATLAPALDTTADESA